MKAIILSLIAFVSIGIVLAVVYVDCPNIVDRAKWGAREPMEIKYLIIPVKYVIIHHTVSQTCSNETRCSYIVSNIQDYHLYKKGYKDISYNFLIGGDGNVYEGVGWHKEGEHSSSTYNNDSIGIAFIGDYTNQLPNDKQLETAKKLIDCGVGLGKISRRYKLLGAKQVKVTQSPGIKLYSEIQNWSHYARSP